MEAFLEEFLYKLREDPRGGSPEELEDDLDEFSKGIRGKE